MGTDLRALLHSTREDHIAQQKDNYVDPVAGEPAFVCVAKAECRYEPREEAAISMSPPYGTEIFAEKMQDDWVLVHAFAKKAWTKRGNLSRDYPRPVPDWVKQVETQAREEAINMEKPSSPESKPRIEVGPRGGIFTRTKTGFRRYF